MTQQTEGWAIAGTASTVARMLSQSASQTVAPGFELVLLGADGASVLKATFSRVALQQIDWRAVDSGDGTDLFQAATSYEWMDESDWRSLLTSGELGDEERPTAAEFPQAKLDDSAIRRMASAAAASWSTGGDAATSTVNIDGPAADRAVTLVLDAESPDNGLSWLYRMGASGSFAIPRLARDPTVSSVVIVLRDNGTEIVRARYDRASMRKADWSRIRVGDWYGEAFRLASSYLWSDEAEWGRVVSELPSSRHNFPISK